jgi:hypothetical protein
MSYSKTVKQFIDYLYKARSAISKKGKYFWRFKEISARLWLKKALCWEICASVW